MSDATITMTLTAPKVDGGIVAQNLANIRRALADIEHQITGEPPVATWEWPQGEMALTARANGVSSEGLASIKHAFYLGVTAAATPNSDAWPEEIPASARDAIIRLVLSVRDLEQLVIGASDEASPIVVTRTQDIASLKGPLGGKRPKWTSSYGVVDGILDLISVRQALRFSIADLTSGSKVVCHFAPEMLDDVKGALGRRVVAEGDVSADSNGKPRSITNIAAFWVRGEPISIAAFVGRLPGLIGNEDPTGHVMRIRRQGL